MTQKPSDQLPESLSAMMDDEASELEMRRVLKDLDGNEQALDKWRRYHLIGAAMRKEPVSAGSVNLAASVSAELFGDPLPSGGYSGSKEAVADAQPATLTARPKWQGFLGQGMVAASIAAVFVLGFNQFSGESVDSLDTQFAVTSSVLPVEMVVNDAPLGFDFPLPQAKVVSTNSANIPSNNQQQVIRYVDSLADPATQNLLNDLLIDHAERSSVNGSLGLMPFARVSKMSKLESQ